VTRSLFVTGSALALAAAAPAAAQEAAPARPAPAPASSGGRSVDIAPYIELNQVVVAGDAGTGAGNGGDDVLTYTEIAAGIDASISTARAEGQLSYRYERRIQWDDAVADDDIHTGLARGSFRLTRDLTLDAGAIATRTRTDIRGAAPGILEGNVANVSQVYSLYAGPSLSTAAGPLSIGASYVIGYTKVEEPNSVLLAPGTRPRDYFDDSWGQAATASVGLAPGDRLPFGVTLSGGWQQERASQLKQRYTDVFGRGDVLWPVSRTLALTAGVGYQKIKVSQRDALVDAAGDPVLDGRGRYVTDPASPRRIAFDTDGLIYDAGVVWRPSPRTSLTATVAHQYGGTSVTGTFSWQARRDMALYAGVYDGIETFGHQLRRGLQALPTRFAEQRNSFGNQFNGCIFGTNLGAAGGGAGGCLTDVLQSVTSASYRARGIDAVLVVERGATSFGVGGGYANRRFHDGDPRPGVTLFGIDDESWYAQAFWTRQIDRNSGLDANLFANWYDSDQPGFGGTSGAGATASYYRNFGRLGTIAQIGVYTYDQDGFDSQWAGQALVGARYSF
jgi:hypothetical protein